MIPVTFNSAPAYLLDDAPKWSGGVELEAVIPNSYERGLTGRETRRPTGDTLRLSLKWSAVISDEAALANLRNSLQGWNAQPVLCPLWPFPVATGTSTPSVAASYYVLMGDGSAPVVEAAASLPFSRPAYPLLVGILSNPPDPEMFGGTGARVDFEFAESSDLAITPPTFSAPAGISAASGVRPLFPFAPNWNSPPKSGSSEFDIDRRQLGAGRELAQAYYAQRPRRRVEHSFTLSDLDAFNLLSFMTTMGGEQNSFWLPTALAEVSLAADVASADTTLTVDAAANLGTNIFYCLVSGSARVPVKVTNVTGNVLALSAAVGADLSAASTRLESMALARFDALKIALSFLSTDLATATVKFKELPWETAAVAGETIDVTMGALPTTAMLYVFTLTIPGSPAVYRLTNFERDLTNGGHTFTHANIENDDVVELPSLERQTTTIKTRNFSGNPLALLVPFQLEWPMEVQIYEADVSASAASSLRCLFSGEVADANIDGPFIDATVQSLSWLFDRAAARRLYQPSDNWVLFEPSDGLDPNNWKWAAKVVSYDPATATLIVGTITSSNGATLAAHFFAAGYVEVISGGVGQYRTVSESLAVSGGQVTMYLSNPLVTAPSVGDDVNMFAGYDGQYASTIGTGKFSGSGIIFGGFPFIPTGNPFVLKIQTPSGGAGKK